MVNVWRHEVSVCATADDLDRLKRTDEFKAAWSKMGPDDRAKVRASSQRLLPLSHLKEAA